MRKSFIRESKKGDRVFCDDFCRPSIYFRIWAQCFSPFELIHSQFCAEESQSHHAWIYECWCGVFDINVTCACKLELTWLWFVTLHVCSGLCSWRTIFLNECFILLLLTCSEYFQNVVFTGTVLIHQCLYVSLCVQMCVCCCFNQLSLSAMKTEL